MTGKLERQILLALLAPILLGAFVLDFRLARDPRHGQIAADIADLRRSEDALNQAMAGSPAVLLADYDPLTAAAQQMAFSGARLPGDLHCVYSGRQAAPLDPALRAYLDALAQKLTRVEDFKTRDALLRSGPTGGGLPPSLGSFPSEDGDGRTRTSLTAFANAYEMQNMKVRLAALLSGLGFALVSALLLEVFSAPWLKPWLSRANR